jgi:hypothetical protein
MRLACRRPRSPRPGRIARRGGRPAGRPGRRSGPPTPRTVRRPAGSPGHGPGPGHSSRRSASTRRVRWARSDHRPGRRVRFARWDRRRPRGRVRFAGSRRHEPMGRARLARSPRRLHYGQRPGWVPPNMEPERRIPAPVPFHGVGCPRGGMTVRLAGPDGSPVRRRLGPARRSRPGRRIPGPGSMRAPQRTGRRTPSSALRAPSPRRGEGDSGRLGSRDLPWPSRYRSPSPRRGEGWGEGVHSGALKGPGRGREDDRRPPGLHPPGGRLRSAAGPRCRARPRGRPPDRPRVRPSSPPPRARREPRAPDRRPRRRPRAGASPGY